MYLKLPLLIIGNQLPPWQQFLSRFHLFLTCFLTSEISKNLGRETFYCIFKKPFFRKLNKKDFYPRTPQSGMHETPSEPFLASKH